MACALERLKNGPGNSEVDSVLRLHVFPSRTRYLGVLMVSRTLFLKQCHWRIEISTRVNFLFWGFRSLA